MKGRVGQGVGFDRRRFGDCQNAQTLLRHLLDDALIAPDRIGFDIRQPEDRLRRAFRRFQTAVIDAPGLDESQTVRRDRKTFDDGACRRNAERRRQRVNGAVHRIDRMRR